MVSVRDMGGAPRNPAPRKHFLAWIVKSSGCHCTDAFGGKNIADCRPLSVALPLSPTEGDSYEEFTRLAETRLAQNSLNYTQLFKLH